MKLDRLLDFVKFTHKFQKIRRIILVNGEDRDENDSEHSFQLALLGWYIVQIKKLKLDIEKIIKYSLAHDLVEVYAGDTYFHTIDKAQLKAKVEKEKKALEQIKSNFPEIKEIHNTIQAYEDKVDEEAKFVYALDKMIPVLNIYLDNGRSWQREKVTYEMIRTKDKKIAVSPDILEEWEELVKLLDKNKSKLFHNSLK